MNVLPLARRVLCSSARTSTASLAVEVDVSWTPSSSVRRALRTLEFLWRCTWYVKGGHAFGLRRRSAPITEWPELAEKWLGTIGMIPK